MLDCFTNNKHEFTVPPSGENNVIVCKICFVFYVPQYKLVHVPEAAGLA